MFGDSVVRISALEGGWADSSAVFVCWYQEVFRRHGWDVVEMECAPCSALVRSRAEYSTVWACFRSSVNASTLAERMLGMENLACVNGPSVTRTTLGVGSLCLWMRPVTKPFFLLS